MTLISGVLSLLSVRYILFLNVKLNITLLITLNYNLIIFKVVDGRFISMNTYSKSSVLISVVLPGEPNNTNSVPLVELKEMTIH